MRLLPTFDPRCTNPFVGMSGVKKPSRRPNARTNPCCSTLVRSGATGVTSSIANAYREKHSDVTEQAQMVEQTISHAESFTGRSGRFSPHVIEAIVKSALGMFDARNGGFGQAPKFPHPGVLDLLMEHNERT